MSDYETDSTSEPTTSSSLLSSSRPSEDQESDDDPQPEDPMPVDPPPPPPPQQQQPSTSGASSSSFAIVDPSRPGPNLIDEMENLSLAEGHMVNQRMRERMVEVYSEVIKGELMTPPPPLDHLQNQPNPEQNPPNPEQNPPNTPNTPNLANPSSSRTLDEALGPLAVANLGSLVGKTIGQAVMIYTQGIIDAALKRAHDKMEQKMDVEQAGAEDEDEEGQPGPSKRVKMADDSKRSKKDKGDDDEDDGKMK